MKLKGLKLRRNLKLKHHRTGSLTISTILDVLSKVVQIGAIVIGGFWTYNLFELYRDGSGNLDIKVEPKVIKNSDQMLASVTIKLKNIGKVSIRTRPKTEEGEHEGLELTIIEYKSGEQISATARDQVVDWNNATTNGKREWPVEKYNVLKDYAAFQGGNFLLSAGGTDNESVVIPVKPNTLYGFRARFFSSDGWSNADIVYLYTDTKTPSVQ